MKTLLFGVIAFLFYNEYGLADEAYDIWKAKEALENTHNFRETAVHSVSGKVDQKTFAAVCKPVGQQLKALAQKHQVQVIQVSDKYRNPKHQAQGDDLKMVQQFQKKPELQSLQIRVGDKQHYYRRIAVRKACLNCHGSKEDRPDFIKKKYPGDRAYGFQEGDLRGLYKLTW